MTANGTHHRFRDYAKAIDNALDRLTKGVPLLTTARDGPARSRWSGASQRL